MAITISGDVWLRFLSSQSESSDPCTSSMMPKRWSQDTTENQMSKLWYLNTNQSLASTRPGRQELITIFDLTSFKIAPTLSRYTTGTTFISPGSACAQQIVYDIYYWTCYENACFNLFSARWFEQGTHRQNWMQQKLPSVIDERKTQAHMIFTLALSNTVRRIKIKNGMAQTRLRGSAGQWNGFLAKIVRFPNS